MNGRHQLCQQAPVIPVNINTRSENPANIAKTNIRNDFAIEVIIISIYTAIVRRITREKLNGLQSNIYFYAYG